MMPGWSSTIQVLNSFKGPTSTGFNHKVLKSTGPVTDTLDLAECSVTRIYPFCQQIYFFQETIYSERHLQGLTTGPNISCAYSKQFRAQVCLYKQLYKKKVRNMPPQKMNPSSTPESLLSEFFDPEYTKCEPRLSLIEDAPRGGAMMATGGSTIAQMLQKRSKSERALNTLGPLEFYKPGQLQHLQVQEESSSNQNNNPFSSSMSRQTGSAQRIDPQTTRAGVKATKNRVQNQSPTFKNFQYSIFKRKKDQQNFSNFKKTFNPGVKQPVIHRNPQNPCHMKN